MLMRREPSTIKTTSNTKASYSQQGSLKPQFLQTASLVPGKAEILLPHIGQFCVGNNLFAYFILFNVVFAVISIFFVRLKLIYVI
ncbi:MAG: hypothetical protein KatS3mg090_1009 [Patescibacteria group bacterium]|nr:MAG: hypothetical protein KatS3mg090_0125 [Patescibacteria group bacterium]GIW63183.1 MAG: hypothetical protein KatS3mg090_1009 [Patescibacteria group bacterium]